jgi:hypothetical protein
VAALALANGGVRRAGGVLEAHGPWLAWILARLPPRPGGVAALTLGHVVIGRDRASLSRTRAHERVHVAQYARWGPAFLPAYALASLWAVARGRHPYHGNRFEREAFRPRTRGREDFSDPATSPPTDRRN